MTEAESIRPDDETLASAEVQIPLSAEYQEIAAKLYQEDFVLIVPEEYTQFLAALDPESAIIRQHYMDMFTWDANLLALTRMLCRKLYLKGESQEIDRILSAFTKLYLKQHPANAFCTTEFEQIYIVLYSLILLNTALHNNEVKRSLRISQADYIRNTLATFLQQNGKGARPLLVRQKIRIERELHLFYDDLVRAELYLKRTAPDLPKPRRNPNRYLVAETIMSSYSHASDQSRDDEHGHGQNSLNTHDIQNSHNGQSTPNHLNTHNIQNGHSIQNGHIHAHNPHAHTDRRVSDKHDDSLLLSHQRSGGSHWSTDESRRGSFSLRRAPPALSARFGFTRALYSDPAAARAAPLGTLRNHRSLDFLGHPNALTRHPSHGLTTTENHIDQYSVLTVDAPDNFHLDLDPKRSLNVHLDDFDVDDYQDRFDLTLELRGAPYLKEGLLKLRILHNDMADFSTTSELAVLLLLALSTVLVSSSRPGLFSFFKRTSDPLPPQPVGTGTNTGLFSHKQAEYFVVVSKGELRLYSFDPKVVKKQQARKKKLHFDDDESAMGDGNWLKNAANVGNYNLCATVAARHEPHSSHSGFSHSEHGGSGKILWSLTFPKTNKHPPKKFIFEAGTVEVATEFIDTCNFWASKISAVPTLEESMSSIEYGWTDLGRLHHLGDSFKRIKCISKYEQIPKGVYLSNYVMNDTEEELTHEGLLKQFMQTLRYYNNLKLLYNKFSKTRSSFMKDFRKYLRSSNYKLVLTNYDIRTDEYKAELNKYKSYVDMLGYGLKLRFELEEQDIIELWESELANSEPPLDENKIRLEIKNRLDARLAEESSLSKAVRVELAKRFSGAEADVSSFDPNAPLVKSPKNFSLSNIKEMEMSPITQLLSVDSKSPEEVDTLQVNHELIASFSTNTITEEEEPEEDAEKN